VLPTNVALSFGGYSLNEIAIELGIRRYNTIDYTQELNSDVGFKNIAFDSLENFLSAHGDDTRGYILDEVESIIDGKLDSVEDLPEFNGTVIYNSNPVLQFNTYTNRTKQLEKDSTLRGSAQFAAAAKISDGDKVEITYGDETVIRVFKLETDLKGTIALNPTFDVKTISNRYKFEKSKITRIANG